MSISHDTTNPPRAPRRPRETKAKRDARRNLNLKERRLLWHIASRSDVLDVVTAGGVHEPPFRGAILEHGFLQPTIFVSPPSRWLLVPVTDRMLDDLALIEAEREDMEEDDPAEDDGTLEVSTRSECINQTEAGGTGQDDDLEPSLGATNTFDQRVAWQPQNDDGWGGLVDGEEDAGEGREKDDDFEPNLGWEHQTPISDPLPPPAPVKRVKGKPHVHPTLGLYEPM